MELRLNSYEDSANSPKYVIIIIYVRFAYFMIIILIINLRLSLIVIIVTLLVGLIITYFVSYFIDCRMITNLIISFNFAGQGLEVDFVGRIGVGFPFGS
jgi:hypothetical protein